MVVFRCAKGRTQLYSEQCEIGGGEGRSGPKIKVSTRRHVECKFKICGVLPPLLHSSSYLVSVPLVARTGQTDTQAGLVTCDISEVPHYKQGAGVAQ